MNTTGRPWARENAVVETHAWNERLDLGDEAMDHEHHLQIALVSAIADAVEQGRPWMARRLSAQLAAFAGAHFGSEELLMEASGYSEGAVHAAEHAALTGRIAGLAELLEDDEASLALEAALDLRERLAAHIAGSDRKLAERLG